MAKSGWRLNRKAREIIVRQIIDTYGVEAMDRVAKACDADAGITGQEAVDGGYMVSTEGDDGLRKQDYRVTVITATPQAIRHDRKHDTLLKNFYLAGEQ